MKILPSVVSLSVVGILLSGCATTSADNDKLSQAQAEYDKASDNAKVAQAAPKHLQAASKQLDKADTAVDEGGSKAAVEHYAYLASQQVAIARQDARKQEAQQAIENAKAQRKELKAEANKQKAQSAREKNAELQKKLSDLKAEQSERGLVLTLGDVLFAIDKAELKQSGHQTVAKLSEFMNEYSDRNVRIEGYTDSTGAAEYNQKLSERRAEAVSAALIEDGIDSDRIETRGFGEKHPADTNDTRAGRQQNRRVEVVISDENGEFTDEGHFSEGN